MSILIEQKYPMPVYKFYRNLYQQIGILHKQAIDLCDPDILLGTLLFIAQLNQSLSVFQGLYLTISDYQIFT